MKAVGFADSLNQRDTSGALEQMMSGIQMTPYRNNNYNPQGDSSPNNPRLRYGDIREDYKNYVQEVGSQLKNKKSRMEIEREKQSQRTNEVALADQIYNSRMHQDHL